MYYNKTKRINFISFKFKRISQANTARARATVKLHVQITLRSDLTYDVGRGRVWGRSNEDLTDRFSKF